ncbi:MAG TPA: Gfo/Idh/MocA family oxidoreductase [Anaerolineae bacterium]|nr:Gfo/Idh/MocA family oxidoreductase [Anaerolineae bacterium]
MAQQKLRWGVLGTARITRELVRAWSLSKMNELVAIGSRNAEKGNAWAAKNHAAHVFDSYDALLASDVIDAVYIPLPNGLHKEWTVKAAQQGKHVLCEKPLADNAAQVQEVIAARDKYGVKIMEAFMYRFHPKTLKTKQMLDDGAVGDVKLIRATFNFFLRDPRNIRMNKGLAGGALMDVGCYPVNISRLMVGANPIAVQARAVWGEDAAKVMHDEPRVRTLPEDEGMQIGTDHTMTALLEFPNNVLALVDASFSAIEHQWLGVSGTKGHIGVTAAFRFGYEDQVILYEHDGGHEDVIVPGGNEYQMMVDHFADAVINGKPLSYTLEDSLGQARTMDAMYEAARTGKRVLL